jgi:alkyl hydroperoxide reductase subunit AhpC
MSVRIGDEAPNFTAETTGGKIDFHQWIGDGWAILFSHPKDFTPVCTTELGYMAKLKPEFQKRNCKVIGLSIDPVGDHERWAKDIEETQGANVFVIGPDKKVKLILVYPMSAGRNFDELLRVIDALQLNATQNLATPADWRPGQAAIIPTSVKDEDAKKLFPQGFKTLKPYLRIVQPK